MWLSLLTAVVCSVAWAQPVLRPPYRPRQPALQPMECARQLCQRLGPADCLDEINILPLVQACARNNNLDCIETVCRHVGVFGCDDRLELIAIAQSCQDNIDGRCVEAACNSRGRLDCDSATKILPLAQACGGHVY